MNIDQIVWDKTQTYPDVSGHKRVWAQTCLGTSVSGQKHVWAQTCVGTSVWDQSCKGTNVVEPQPQLNSSRRVPISDTIDIICLVFSCLNLKNKLSVKYQLYARRRKSTHSGKTYSFVMHSPSHDPPPLLCMRHAKGLAFSGELFQMSYDPCCPLSLSQHFA